MELAIQNEETFLTGILRIMNEHLIIAIQHLSEANDIHQAVHQTRRSLKIVRATLRIIRLDLGNEKFKILNRFYRDEARKLSDLRDASALLEVLEIIETQFRAKFSNKEFQDFKNSLMTERENIILNMEKEFSLFQEITNNLQTSIPKINHITLSEDFKINVIGSLQKVYARGYYSFKINKIQPSPHTMHEWRKRVKYLRYQISILQNSWIAILIPLEKELHALSDILGNYQNLTVLIQYLLAEDAQLSEGQKSNLLALSYQHQKQLYNLAIPLGQKIYAEHPKAFGKRFKKYLGGWIE